jgi:hypothetical protein
MRRTSLLPALAAALAAVTLGAATANANDNNGNDCAARNSRGRDLQVVGLVADGTLVCFEDDRPRRADTIGTVSGLQQDVSLIGIDYRPANNTLYGVGNAGGVYTIDANTAQATLVSRLNQPLAGTNFGVDFNPAVDRLRIVSAETGQNLRVNVDDGTTNVDGTLNIPGATPVNPALGLSAVAYTNNDADPNTVTTLFDIDTTNDNVAIQAPANAGALSPTGKLGVDAASPVGFDIYSSLRYGTTAGLRPLATFAGPDGKTNLYRVDLLAGRVSPVGTFRVPVVDIAIPTDQS